ncbi:hypothetical protein D3C80_1909300 [compost metagenome]
MNVESVDSEKMKPLNRGRNAKAMVGRGSIKANRMRTGNISQSFFVIGGAGGCLFRPV